jgi:hypothetical protein
MGVPPGGNEDKRRPLRTCGARRRRKRKPGKTATPIVGRQRERTLVPETPKNGDREEPVAVQAREAEEKRGGW